MDLLILQLFAAIFALFALSRVYLRFKEKKLSSLAFIFWTLVWVGGVLAILLPDMTTDFAKLVGIGRGSDAVLYASIVMIFYLIFRIYIKTEDTQRQMTELSRKIALQTSTSKKRTLSRKHAK